MNSNNLTSEELELIAKMKEKAEALGVPLQTEWNKEDKQYLLENYKDKSFTEIAKTLNKTTGSVTAMASRMDLKRPKKISKDDINYILENYTNNEISIGDIAIHLNVSEYVVSYHAKKFGLSRKNRWSKEEEETLINLYRKNKSVSEIAKVLSKTERAIESKRSRLGLKRNK